MPTYNEYQIDENTTVLIEAPQSSGGLVPAARGGDAVQKSQKTLGEAWKGIRAQAGFLIQELDSLAISEAEIKFGIKTSGDFDFVVSKLGMEVNYEVTLKWKKKE
jgi:hypothetical protein